MLDISVFDSRARVAILVTTRCATDAVIRFTRRSNHWSLTDCPTVLSAMCLLSSTLYLPCCTNRSYSAFSSYSAGGRPDVKSFSLFRRLYCEALCGADCADGVSWASQSGSHKACRQQLLLSICKLC